MSDVNDFLMGGGIPAAKFPSIGTVVRGPIVNSEVTQQTDFKTGALKFWDNGQPMNQAVITLQTDERDPQIDGDSGLRKLYVKGQMQAAVRDAVKQSGASGLELGGVLAVKFDHEEPSKQPGANAKKVYVAQYKPPTPGTEAANDLIGAGVGAAPAGSQPGPSDLI